MSEGCSSLALSVVHPYKHSTRTYIGGGGHGDRQGQHDRVEAHGCRGGGGGGLGRRSLWWWWCGGSMSVVGVLVGGQSRKTERFRTREKGGGGDWCTRGHQPRLPCCLGRGRRGKEKGVGGGGTREVDTRLLPKTEGRQRPKCDPHPGGVKSGQARFVLFAPPTTHRRHACWIRRAGEKGDRRHKQTTHLYFIWKARKLLEPSGKYQLIFSPPHLLSTFFEGAHAAGQAGTPEAPPPGNPHRGEVWRHKTKLPPPQSSQGSKRPPGLGEEGALPLFSSVAQGPPGTSTTFPQSECCAFSSSLLVCVWARPFLSLWFLLWPVPALSEARHATHVC